LKVIRYRSIEDELACKVDTGSIGVHLLNFTTGGPGDGCWYLAFRAVEKFREKYYRYPGESTQTPHDDYENLKPLADTLVTSLGFDADQLPPEYLQELCRYGNSQIHNIAAVLGGVAAQETIKLLTHQWVPLNNTFIFNGINSASASFSV